jgi:hypothetical protein
MNDLLNVPNAITSEINKSVHITQQTSYGDSIGHCSIVRYPWLAKQQYWQYGITKKVTQKIGINSMYQSLGTSSTGCQFVVIGQDRFCQTEIATLRMLHNNDELVMNCVGFFGCYHQV